MTQRRSRLASRPTAWLALLTAGAAGACSSSNGSHAIVDGSPHVHGGSRDAGQDGIPAPRLTCAEVSLSPCPPPGHATWPMPNPDSLALPHPQSFQIDLAGDLALDEITGLQWQRAHSAKVTHAEAHALCQQLVAGGQDDFRLPSRIELVSIVDFARRPTADARAFPATADDYFWSASITPFDPSLAFSVYFGAGLTAYGNVAGASAHVRCVRGGGPGAWPRFATTAVQVHDLNTGLRWQRELEDVKLAWDSAREYCDTLTLGGATDWRLPSTKELQTLVDENRQGADVPLFDSALFPEPAAARYWTGSAVNKAGIGQYVFFEARDGATEEAAATEAYRVRCVR